MTLFEPAAEAGAAPAPLATRMRPRTLDEFVGQEHLVGPGTPLRRAIEQDDLHSAILWGPAGCGKSTIAHVIAAYTQAHFEPFSAVTAGVAHVRKAIAAARTRRRASGQRTILFIDEIHRFNKAQQDAFLPFVEDGTIVLLGATTENPYFEINSPLLSRSTIYTLDPLSPEQIGVIVDGTMADRERGLGELNVELTPDAREFLVTRSGGDARVALNTVEAAAGLAHPDERDRRTITLELAERGMQQRHLDYDKGGDAHYDVISAFIKSVRGSDPDAALYWLARMLLAGEDARFIARRLVILASEDIGNADPMGLTIAASAAHAVEFVGLPEAQLCLAQATTYLAAAPKSNASYLGLNRAMEDVRRGPAARVPLHLRSTAYPAAAELGHGADYQYAHDFPGHFAAQDYLPPGVKTQPYYEPTDLGYEAKIKRHMQALEQRRREVAEESKQDGDD
ncbi:AAA family ATPase [candidate division KD3-62 bacterium DG_56]|uniref:AAA family ATPase n=1 Tax=candidate division KD3-62 bacterium DG_56 TaxID=1704032 RepID=A0A0S7XLY9_9BACT|nr:MAG: AAA family ATPase [candidate division KD3-62 bacterium DG_56]